MHDRNKALEGHSYALKLSRMPQLIDNWFLAKYKHKRHHELWFSRFLKWSIIETLTFICIAPLWLHLVKECHVIWHNNIQIMHVTIIKPSASLCSTTVFFRSFLKGNMKQTSTTRNWIWDWLGITFDHKN